LGGGGGGAKKFFKTSHYTLLTGLRWVPDRQPWVPFTAHGPWSHTLATVWALDTCSLFCEPHLSSTQSLTSLKWATVLFQHFYCVKPLVFLYNFNSVVLMSCLIYFNQNNSLLSCFAYTRFKSIRIFEF
jgi:hypothetical protein